MSESKTAIQSQPLMELLSELALDLGVSWNRYSDKIWRQIDFNQINVYQGGYIQDFIRARNNGFLASRPAWLLTRPTTPTFRVASR